jgi:hypothetical protein
LNKYNWKLGVTYRAGESNFLDKVMGAQGFTQAWSIVKISGKNIKNAWLEASFFSQICQTENAQWCLRRRFYDHRTTSSKGSTTLSKDHAIQNLVSIIFGNSQNENSRNRKVPWNKSGSYTNWLFDSDMPSSRLGWLRDCSSNSLCLACEPPGETCGVIDLSSSFSKRFASLVGQYLRQVFLVLSDQSVPFHKQLSTCPWIDELVFEKGSVRCLYGFIDVFSCVIRT